jgi:archaellum biogenesis ATPase FlaH
MLGMTTTNDPGISGIRDIADAMGGGIKENSFVLIEGEAKAGKSVLCQHIAYGVLSSRSSSVAYYSSEFSAYELVDRMRSLALDPRQALATDRFRVFKIYSKTIIKDAEKSLDLIIGHIKELPSRFQLVIIDSPSVYLNRVSTAAKVNFLYACKELCEGDRSIIMVLDVYAFERDTLLRAYAMSDYYLRLKSNDAMTNVGMIDTRNIKTLQVTKLCGGDCYGQQGMKFEVKPGLGIQILPFQHIRV